MESRGCFHGSWGSQSIAASVCHCCPFSSFARGCSECGPHHMRPHRPAVLLSVHRTGTGVPAPRHVHHQGVCERSSGHRPPGTQQLPAAGAFVLICDCWVSEGVVVCQNCVVMAILLHAFVCLILQRPVLITTKPGDPTATLYCTDNTARCVAPPV